MRPNSKIRGNTMMKLFRPSAALPILLLAWTAGCTQQTGPTDEVPSGTGQEQQELSPNAKPQRSAESRPEGRGPGAKGARRGGPAMLLRAALGEVELRADQKASIEQLIAGLEPERTGARGEPNELDRALAAAVRSGSFDSVELKNQIASLDKRAEEHAGKVRAALDSLHSTLDASQRAALVAAIEKKMDSAPKWGDGERKAAFGERGHAGWKHGGGDMHMARALDLSEEQQTQLRSMREKAKQERTAEPSERKDFRADAKKMLEAFAADDFDANAQLKSMPGAGRRGQLAEHHVAEIKALYDVLDAEQRTKLASALEQGRGQKH
jgi:Spy/CpxP family protein refolding chaperone